MLDMAAVIATHFANDTDITAPVYADSLPEGVSYPYVLVRNPNVGVLLPGIDGWDVYEVQVDMVAAHDAAGALIDLVGIVRSKLSALTGVVGAAGVAGTVITSTTKTVDDTVSPARPRWVLTVEVTASSI